MSSRGWGGPVALACALWASLASAQEPNAPPPAPPPRVDRADVGPTPALGSAVPLDQVPANVQVIDRATLDAHPTAPLSTTLANELSSTSLSDTQGSPYGASLNLRGYTASPVLGSPQGIAVYQNGQRINDPFGDVVSWTTLPSFAVDRVEVTPGSSPVFGLNAQGGAAALRMKDGFSAPGLRLTTTADSFGAVSGTAEYGIDGGDRAFYGGVSALHDHGWRDDSPANVFQSFLSLATRSERLDTGLEFTFADADYRGNGASPVQLLSDDYSAVFTTPDETSQLLFNLAGHAGLALGAETTLEGSAYLRHNTLRTSNGDQSDLAPCTGIGGSAAFLCSGAGTPGETLATDASGGGLPSTLDVSGVLNETYTLTQSTGATLQLGDHRELFGDRNVFLAGAALDFGFTDYQTHSLGGALDDSRNVESLGFSLGNEDLNTRLRAQNRDVGIYFSDVASLTQRLSATVAGRLNLAHVGLSDLEGNALDGSHDYSRFNPSVGLTYALASSAGVYVSYGEANRAPTAAELACADPERPCRVPNAFTADPSLDQVVTRTAELGARGSFSPDWLGRDDVVSVQWSAAFYSSWNHDDILFIASAPVVGSGYFANAGATRRVGVEAALTGHWNAGSWFVRYGFVDATFQSDVAILSPENPFADTNGDIHAQRGDRLPNIPAHSLRAGFEAPLTEHWAAGLDATWASGRRYQGDESNQMRQVPGFAIASFQSRYRFSQQIEARFRIENLFDSKYYTSGVLGNPSAVFPSMSDPRFLVPGRPRSYELALSVRF
ncbi:MAG TPA: TonB-dependent receptor [Myxococcota bacterium]|nr:TonB-dependent receptor [Myxococcota bacterium]